MRAVLYRGPGQLTIEEVEKPQIGPGEILVRVRAALTCGTDLKAYLRGHHLVTPPSPFGHEFAGEVAALGEGVARFSVGQPVATANSAPCQRCFFCKRGQENLCENIIFNWGAFAEYIRLPAPIVEQNTHPVPPGLSYEEAALLEPLACVVAGNERAGIALGDTVVIAGGTGPIGLLHLQLALHRGAREVIAIGLKDERWPVAQELGVSHLIDARGEDVVGRVMDLTGGRGADVVIEAVGVPEVWEMALGLVRKGGTVLFFGGCPSGSRVSLDPHRVHYHELTIKGSFHHTPRTVEVALSLLASGVVKAKPLITAKLPLERLEEGLLMMKEGRAVKVAIIP